MYTGRAADPDPNRFYFFLVEGAAKKPEADKKKAAPKKQKAAKKKAGPKKK